MMNDMQQHVGEQLSGYVDGELTQQERQRVDLHCQQCKECSKNLEDLAALKQQIAAGRLSVIGEDKWRENMNDPTVETSRNLGWILFIGGVLVAGAVGLFGFVTDAGIPVWTKLMLGAIYGGLAVLLGSVLRQRLLERKTDNYKDVEI
jgi:predicted anti-sigma-YlaC factor YlaD